MLPRVLDDMYISAVDRQSLASYWSLGLLADPVPFWPHILPLALSVFPRNFRLS